MSRADTIKANATFEVECPSGNQYLLRKGSPREVVLLSQVVPVPDSKPQDDERAALSDELRAREEANKPDFVKDAEAEQNLAIAEAFCREYVLDPKIVFTSYGEDVPDGCVAYWMVSGDVNYLIKQWGQICAGQPLKDLVAPFRGESGGAPNRPDSEAIREATP